MITILSLGAGVQSSVVLLRCLAGDAGFPALDHAIFADTGYEPPSVYAHLERLKGVCARHALPLHVVRRTADQAWDTFRNQMPVHIRNQAGALGMTRRHCTKDYKVQPIKDQTRALVGYGPGEAIRVTAPLWTRVLGISADEAHRMKDPDGRFEAMAYPLIDLRITRADCERWLRQHWPYPVQRSACVMCPLHNTRDWRELKRDDPASFAAAVAYDEELRCHPPVGVKEGPAFLHFSGRPLAEIDLSTLEDHGQQNLFGNECEGMCGV